MWVVIVRACGRSSKHRRSDLAQLGLNLPRRDYWMPRLKRGMTNREGPRALPRSIHRRVAAVGRARDHLLEGLTHGHVEIDAFGRNRLEATLVLEPILLGAPGGRNHRFS